MGSPGSVPAEPVHPIVAALAEQRRRQRQKFRVIFVVTWMAIIFGALGALVWAGKIDFGFMAEWMPYVIGGRYAHPPGLTDWRRQPESFLGRVASHRLRYAA